MLYGQTNVPAEFPLTAGKKHRDIFNEIEVDVIFTGTGGHEWQVPAFWAGGNEFRVRFAASEPGRCTWRSVCSDKQDAGLHGQKGVLEVTTYEGNNPLYRRGRLQVSQNKRFLEHADGTPFFWLGDTWWMELCKRLGWPGDFQLLAADRAAKGFSVIQIIAGLYPDMPAFDERGANEAGFPWEKDYARINPAYFDMADLRINWLVRSGLTPCIVGCWGYFLPWMGIEKMKRHWRNLVARYGVYPVVWCLAGEGVMPYYLSETKEKDSQFQKKGWTEIGRYVRGVDPYHNLITIHPTRKGRDQVEDPAVLDFDMLQTGHGDRQSLPATVSTVAEAYGREPKMPVIDSEVCYEGIGEACRQEVQRMMFWSCILNGAAGHTYGANGIWQVNTREKPYGPSPHGMAWGNTPWEDAFQLPGSANLSLAKRFLERYPWWRFEPHPEWVEPRWSNEELYAAHCAGIPGEIRIVFIPLAGAGVIKYVKDIEKDIRYHAFLFNPVDGTEHEIGPVTPDENGSWDIQKLSSAQRHPICQDWVLVLERSKETKR
ncbi:MAG: DUF4038 domain-containing protein [Candidatus Omnitrophota bacterium]